MMEINVGMFETLAVTVLVIWLGVFLRNLLPVLKKYCIPSAVVGGTLFAIVTCVLYVTDVVSFSFDTSVTNQLFYCVFFAASGAAASMSLLKKGGKLVIIFAILAAVLAAAQNFLAVGLGKLVGLDPLIALMAGSTPLTGGHGNAASFAPIAESFGAVGAMEVAVASATFGLISGCIIGGPMGNRLIKKHRLFQAGEVNADASMAVEEQPKAKNFVDGKRSMQAVFLLFIACGFGSVLFSLLKGILPPSITLPIHVLCMLGGILVRLVLDRMKSTDEAIYESIDIAGEISLAMFVSMSIMTMKLWQLAELALPLILILVCQVLFVYLFCTLITFRLMGRNYDAAIMAVGNSGFALGAVPVSMSTMQSVCDKYRYSTIAFFVVPVIGGFLSNLTNAAIITTFLNLFSR